MVDWFDFQHTMFLHPREAQKLAIQQSLFHMSRGGVSFIDTHLHSVFYKQRKQLYSISALKISWKNFNFQPKIKQFSAFFSEKIKQPERRLSWKVKKSKAFKWKTEFKHIWTEIKEITVICRPFLLFGTGCSASRTWRQLSPWVWRTTVSTQAITCWLALSLAPSTDYPPGWDPLLRHLS